MDTKAIDRPADMAPLAREGAVAVIRLNYPARRNAFGMQMRTQLRDRLRDAMADDALRAIVITGEGGHFCAGCDISEMEQRSLLRNRERWNVVVDLIRLIAAGPKPVVAAVEGSAMGAGFSIAALADYLVCARDAKFGAAFARMGLMPDMGALWSVQHRVGRAKAREILGLARPFDGAEAHRIGLANEACEPGQALARAMAVGTALLKATLAQGVDSFEQAIRSETEFQAVAMGTADHHEAVRAFMEKRTPVFKGA
jgi:enoyl-CoA hydratase/carnithine racemase